ncbi:MAG: V-type ATP synthase subunit A [Nitrososphaeria archaeon]|nr:V-type ATP synthase subunit A [Nitrososphaeria archaeon]
MLNQRLKHGIITKVVGPVIFAENMENIAMYEMVKVGLDKIIGEVIRIEGNNAVIQVYEDTTGVSPGEPVEPTGSLLSVELGPGLLNQIFDGIQRPLTILEKESGFFIKRGRYPEALPRNMKWPFVPIKKEADRVTAGDILGYVKESPLLEKHAIMVPPHIKEGKLSYIIKEGEYTVEEIIAKIDCGQNNIVEVSMITKWPIRKPRPIKRRVSTYLPLITGQRIIDALFPIAKGGTAAIPGGFGTGKTVMQHQLAQWADANVIVYIGCGERGNEMAEVLERFPELKDPRSGLPLINRTILIANVSNMPIAAREASIYTGMTIAEYYRDMGYDVALMADSTSRWAEALREISGRLEEMPGEEGYPAYLASRIAEFYERAGRCEVLGSDERYGSISVIGAVSPPGADFSEPVTQSTLRVVKVFWALDTNLAQRRHFPAINWLTSYSLYKNDLDLWFAKIFPDWPNLTKEIMQVLQEEEELIEIVRLVGPDALSETQKLILEYARKIREDYLMQQAYSPTDSYCDLKKNYHMMSLLSYFYNTAKALVDNGIPVSKINSLPAVQELGRMKFVPNEEFESFYHNLRERLKSDLSSLTKGVKS